MDGAKRQSPEDHRQGRSVVRRPHEPGGRQGHLEPAPVLDGAGADPALLRGALHLGLEDGQPLRAGRRRRLGHGPVQRLGGGAPLTQRRPRLRRRHRHLAGGRQPGRRDRLPGAGAGRDRRRPKRVAVRDGNARGDQTLGPPERDGDGGRGEADPRLGGAELLGHLGPAVLPVRVEAQRNRPHGSCHPPTVQLLFPVASYRDNDRPGGPFDRYQLLLRRHLLPPNCRGFPRRRRRDRLRHSDPGDQQATGLDFPGGRVHIQRVRDGDEQDADSRPRGAVSDYGHNTVGRDTRQLESGREPGPAVGPHGGTGLRGGHRDGGVRELLRRGRRGLRALASVDDDRGQRDQLGSPQHPDLQRLGRRGRRDVQSGDQGRDRLRRGDRVRVVGDDH